MFQPRQTRRSITKREHTTMLYGARLWVVASDRAFGGPGSSSQNSSLSTRTRTISPWSMYIREAVGVSRSGIGGSGGSESQKYARSDGSLGCIRRGSECRRGDAQCGWLGEVGHRDVHVVEEPYRYYLRNVSEWFCISVDSNTHIVCHPRRRTSPLRAGPAMRTA